jgi:S-adenosylhomocysteine hydrolase
VTRTQTRAGATQTRAGATASLALEAAARLGAGSYQADEEIPASLPMIERLVSERFRGTAPLRGVTAVLIQHQLGDIVAMVNALIQLGLSPSSIHWIDIPYTAHPKVARRLQGLGIPNDQFAPRRYRLDRPYAPYQRRRVQELILALRAKLGPTDRLLVLDDGAYFLEAAACFADPPGRLFLVEQTARGARKLRDDAAIKRYSEAVPVVNVAEARPKKNLETPFIGQAVCHALLTAIESRMDSIAGGPLLVLGFGAVGRAVAESLNTTAGIRRSRIYVADPAPAARRRARDAGFRVWRRDPDEWPRFSLVVGCSGTTSFSVGDRAYLADGAVLASASSGSAELARDQFIELADTHERDDIRVLDRAGLRTRHIHKAICVELVDRTATFLNGGFPVNFDGRVNDIPPRFIQPTKTLMVGAAVEALQTRARGLVSPSQGLMRWVEDRFADTVL